MKRVSIHRIAGIILGLVFLVSAFAKAWDADTFAHMLLQYGPVWFGVFAPVIIFCEVVLGMCLLLRICPRWTAIATDVFLVTVSAVFTYGVIFKGIEDCGCFGALYQYYTPKPWVTYVRNAVLMVLTVPILFAQPEPEKNLTQKLIAMIVVASIACFLCGLAMNRSFRLPRMRSERENRQEMMTKLSRVYPFSTDSTYAVYLFSFECPHCQNNCANVQQYQQLGAADKVLGIAVENEEAQERFERIYTPQITIITIPHDSMSHITHSLPIMVHIEDGAIRNIENGIVFSPGIFME